MSRVKKQLFGMPDFPEYTFTAISLFLYISMASNNLRQLVPCSISNIDACSHWNSYCSFLWCKGSPVSLFASFLTLFIYLLVCIDLDALIVSFPFTFGFSKVSFRALAEDFEHRVLLVELVCWCPAEMFQHVT